MDEKVLFSLIHKTYSEQQIPKISAQLDKAFLKYIFLKAKIGRLRKRALKLQ